MGAAPPIPGEWEGPLAGLVVQPLLLAGGRLGSTVGTLEAAPQAGQQVVQQAVRQPAGQQTLRWQR